MNAQNSAGAAIGLPARPTMEMQARFKKNLHQGHGDQVMGLKTDTTGPVTNTVNWIQDHTILVAIVAMVVFGVVVGVAVGGKQSPR